MADKIVLYMTKITAKTTLKEILENPKSEKILAKHRVPCLSCPMAFFELGELEIGKVAKLYELDLESILKELNNSKS